MGKLKKKSVAAQLRAAGDRSGTIILAPQVLATIARRVTLNTPGVAGMAHAGRRLRLWKVSSPGEQAENKIGRRRLLARKGGEPEGVRVRVEDALVAVDIYIVAQRNVNLHHLGERIQREVSRAIQEMVGLPVSEVNVHIQDVAPSTP